MYIYIHLFIYVHMYEIANYQEKNSFVDSLPYKIGIYYNLQQFNSIIYFFVIINKMSEKQKIIAIIIVDFFPINKNV